jgi:hypothetical protein
LNGFTPELTKFMAGICPVPLEVKPETVGGIITVGFNCHERVPPETDC